MNESQSMRVYFERAKCVDLLAKRYWWPGITADVASVWQPVIGAKQ